MPAQQRIHVGRRRRHRDRLGHREVPHEEGWAVGRDSSQPLAGTAATELPTTQAVTPGAAGSGPRRPVPSCKAKGFSITAGPIARIAPVDLEELEICEMLREARNLPLHHLVTQWQPGATHNGPPLPRSPARALGRSAVRPARVFPTLKSLSVATKSSMKASHSPAASLMLVCNCFMLKPVCVHGPPES